MLELSWGGTRDVNLDGDITLRYIEDGDTVIMKGWCGDNGIAEEEEGGSMKGPGRVGFGVMCGNDSACYSISIQ